MVEMGYDSQVNSKWVFKAAWMRISQPKRG